MSGRIARLTVTYEGVDTEYVLASDYERAEAEVERLRAEAAREHAIAEQMTEEFRKASNEVERLRAALEEIATLSPAQEADWEQEIARAALAEEVTPIQTDP